LRSTTGDPRAPATRHESSGAGQPRADVEDAARRVDTGPSPERLHRFQAAVVILIEGVEVFGDQPLEILP
jgi:hypothetical protein